MKKNIVIAMQVLVLCQISPVLAAGPDGADQDEDLQETVTSMDAYSGMGEQTAISLQLSAKYAADQGDYDKAIKLCKLALKKDYDDMDVHMTYAEALENKLDSQTEQDRELLNKCVREWLIVFRTELGDEKGLSFHGINPFGHFYDDEDRSIPARAHLVTLTGRAPKIWETDEKYLQWVNRPSTSVAGQLLSKKESDNTPAPQKIVKKETDSTN
jgi:tetratricopeptide (TPR) repeat protein